jgi:hypothetical protein
MDFVIVGTFDQAAYYETRVVLMVVGALYHLISKRESRYLVILLSGALLMGVTEYLLQREGLRGEGGMTTLFGWQVPRNYESLLRGILDGGVFGLMALWFADLRISRTSPRASSPIFGRRLWRRWLGWLAMSTLILVLGVLTGSLAAGQSSTSAGSAALATSVHHHLDDLLFTPRGLAPRRGRNGGQFLRRTFDHHPVEPWAAPYPWRALHRNGV